MDQYNSVKAIWLEIDKVHLSYLQTESNSQRFEQKRKLEGFIREYLNLVPPTQRFYFTVTGELLYNSVLSKNKDFSVSKFALAWDALDVYASNLLNHPWRKEYREIRLYSGGYKHQVESQLLCAEEMLMLMGYNFEIELNRLILNSVIDPDTVALVSRDCLLAKVESQIIGEIHSALLSRLGSASLDDVVEYRKRYVGSVSHCVRGLLYQHHQRESVALYSAPAPNLYHMESTPQLGRPLDVYPNFCSVPRYQYPQPTYHDPYRNYGLPSYSFPTVVNDEVDGKFAAQSERPISSCYNNQTAETPSSSYSGLSLQREREARYLPKFLEQIDFDTVERLCYEDVDKRESRKSPSPLRPQKHTKALQKEVAASINGSNEDGAKNLKVVNKDVSEGISSAQLQTKDKLKYSEERKTLVNRSRTDEDKVNGWECLSCTYVNRNMQDICEMCAKSRNVGPEVEPLFRGGRECSKCTLVNPREALYCRACAASLHEAPTYI